jgi:hypothetical protein
MRAVLLLLLTTAMISCGSGESGIVTYRPPPGGQPVALLEGTPGRSGPCLTLTNRSGETYAVAPTKGTSIVSNSVEFPSGDVVNWDSEEVAVSGGVVSLDDERLLGDIETCTVDAAWWATDAGPT